MERSRDPDGPEEPAELDGLPDEESSPEAGREPEVPAGDSAGVYFMSIEEFESRLPRRDGGRPGVRATEPGNPEEEES